MARAYSFYLRERVVRAVASGRAVERWPLASSSVSRAL
jgi:hypothetical protein